MHRNQLEIRPGKTKDRKGKTRLGAALKYEVFVRVGNCMGGLLPGGCVLAWVM